MKVNEIISEAKKKKKSRKPRWAAYGPGVFGMYGTAGGYSGAGGDGGAVGEASYPGNVGAMEVIKFYNVADEEQKKTLKDLIAKGQQKLAWKLIQNVLGVKLQGPEFEDLDEGVKDWLAGAALGTAVALGSPGDAQAANTKPTDVMQKVSQKDVAKTVTGSPHEVVLRKYAEQAGIKGQELAAFLAQAAHETMDFKHMKEIGGSLDFKKYDIRFAPKKARALGNTQPGDGAKFKGRGYLQITGKYNYKKAGQALGLDLINNPELLEKPEVAAKAAVWYWQTRVKDKVANFTDVKAVTKPINPGLKHLDARAEKHQAFKVAMK